MANNQLTGLESWLEGYFRKAPALPERWREVIVKILPWLTLIFFILGLPVVLAFFGLSFFLLPVSFMAGPGEGMLYMVNMVVLAVTLVLEALAIPGLFKKAKSGWNLLFYVTLLNAVVSLLTFNIFGLVIGTLISLYILFQIRSYYH